MRLYATILIVLLVATATSAVPLNPISPDGIAATLSGVGTNTAVLLTNGQVWLLNAQGGWERIYDGALDIDRPLTEIGDWSYTVYIANDGSKWWNPGDGAGWREFPALPVPIPVNSGTFSGVKSMFR